MFRKKRSLTAVFVICLTLSGCSANMPDPNKSEIKDLKTEINSYDNDQSARITVDDMIMYFDYSTCSFTVSRDSHVWKSNPSEPENDKIAQGYFQDRMRSQFCIYYYDSDSELKSMDNYSYSIKEKRYQVKKINSGIEVIFTLGNFERGSESIPKILTGSRYTELFNADTLSSADLNWLDKRYREESGKRVWKETDARLNIDRMLQILDKIGYGDEELKKDLLENGSSEMPVERAAFQITVRYTLSQKGLEVTVPMDQFRFSGDIEPVRLDLLEFFGSSPNTDDGYIFVPDGSGALISLNSGSVTSDTYNAKVYGNQKITSKGEQRVRMPVFGLKNNDTAFLAIIEKGAPIAELNASKSGNQSEMNVVFSSFILKEYAYVVLGNSKAETEILSFQSKMSQDDIKILYCFLSGEDSDYSGMARKYRNYLIDAKTIVRTAKDTDYTLTVDVPGAIKRSKSALLFRYEGWQALTTFQQTADMAEWLKTRGVSSLKIRLDAWLSGGFKQRKASLASPLRVLGGRNGLKKLVESSKTEGYSLEGLYMIGTFTTNSLISRYTDSARTVDQALAEYLSQDMVSEDFKWTDGDPIFLKPSKWLNNVKTSFKRINEPTGLQPAIKDIGDILPTDHSRIDGSDRNKSVKAAQSVFDFLDLSSGITVTGGNSYTFGYTSSIDHAPVRSSGYSVFYRDVPFYSMVLHGSVNISGEPINYSDDFDSAVLKIAETGIGLSSIWIYAPSSIVKDTEWSEFYSSNYLDSAEAVIKAYIDLKEVLFDLQTVAIHKHYYAINDVSVTEYDNGVKIYVNYSESNIEVEGSVVPARSFSRKENPLNEESGS